MSITVQIPTALRRHTAGQAKVVTSAENLPQLLDVLGSTFPDLKPHLRDESGEVRRFLNFYVNEEDIRFLGNSTYRFQDGDEVMIIPSIAGGSTAGDLWA
jgi:sulfur-carrier protein